MYRSQRNGSLVYRGLHQGVTARYWRGFFALPALLLFTLAPLSAVQAEQLYVQSQQAALLAEPRADAPVISRLSQGAALEVLESAPAWYKVRQAEQEGWVFRYFLAAHPPLNKVAPALTKSVDKEHARRRASAVVTAGATRGLTPQDRQRAHEMGIANYSSLARMKENAVDAEQVQRFVQAGIPQ